MRIKSLMNSKKVIAGDGAHLRELINAHNDEGFAGHYSLAEGIVLPGKRTKRHRLASSELYYVVGGRAVMHIDDESAVIEEGDCVDIPPGSVQWVDNSEGSEPFVFLCIVEPAWRAEDEEILE